MNQYFKNIWLSIYTVLFGMSITMRHLFTRNVTVQYPNVHPLDQAGPDKMPSNARNRLFVNMDDCNGCNSCSRACPVNCITVETLKTSPSDNVPIMSDGKKRGLWVTNFQIDFGKCCYCALCVEPCPTEAIHMTTEFEYSTYDRKNLLYTFSTMTTDEIQSKVKMLADDAERKKAEAAKKAAAEKLEAVKSEENN